MTKKIKSKDIKLDTLIGEGVYGQVYKGKYGRKEVVIKEMKFDQTCEYNYKQF